MARFSGFRGFESAVPSVRSPTCFSCLLCQWDWTFSDAKIYVCYISGKIKKSWRLFIFVEYVLLEVCTSKVYLKCKYYTSDAEIIYMWTFV